MYHGLKFDPTGKCIQIPGQDMIPPKLGVRSYPVVERHHLIWIWMGEAGEGRPVADRRIHRICATRPGAASRTTCTTTRTTC